MPRNVHESRPIVYLVHETKKHFVMFYISFRSTDFVDKLRHLYETANKELFSGKPHWTEVNPLKIRQAIDFCKENLPPLLKIDENFGMTSSQMRLHPQLRSLTPLSEKSVQLNQNEELASSLSFCLLKVSHFSTLGNVCPEVGRDTISTFWRIFRTV